MSAHQFAVYTDLVHTWIAENQLGKTIVLHDRELVHRIGTVLRLGSGDKIILFNSYCHVCATIVTVNLKKSITLELVNSKRNTILEPHIVWGLPILKREAFEEALYALCELGVTAIQPLVTQKTQRSWSGQKELARAQAILKAAAEQSKQFVIPELLPVQEFASWVTLHASTSMTLFFDAKGYALTDVIPVLLKKQYTALRVVIGPEGDLTDAEKELLQQHDFVFCRLTPTVLRAQQAVAVGLGILRSLL